ncbi:hypothetical protein OF83DRAFT_1179922 [Amylostereum chailletii]|nr:hypothetical protein OF83DRAFT_1179922 [Amylostereum chailletii]
MDVFPDLRRLCPGDHDVFDVVDININVMDLYQATVAREVDEPDSDMEEVEEVEDGEQAEAGRSRTAGERDSSPSPAVQFRSPLDGFAFRQMGQQVHRPATAGSSSSTQLTKAERRKRAQERARANTAILKFKMRPHVIRKYTKIMQFKCTIAARDLPHTKTAWLGHEALPDGAPASLQKIRWDGRWVSPSSSMPQLTSKHLFSKPLTLVDRNGYIMCAMHGSPDDPTWDKACGRVCLKLVDLGQRFHFNETDSKHRRGEYPCFHAGVSYGGGQKGPINRK